MVRKQALLAFALFIAVPLMAQRISREEYILRYKGVAVDHMERYGIPASIKMAQALLESDNGNSRLAAEANNHFGIKCRGNDWKGETITHHDDARNECFRKYGSVEESFDDHSAFLDNSPRYDCLFKLKDNDYKAWAYGLKDCGYATNPNYPQLLIKIIEDNSLYLLDQGVNVAYGDIRRERDKVVVDRASLKIDVDEYNITIDRSSGLRTGHNNGIPYVLVGQGDTFKSISKATGVSVKRLLKFNDLPSQVALGEGDALYIRKKAKRSVSGYLLYDVKAGDTMHGISQKFGIRLANLHRINNMPPGDRVKEGIQIRLR